MKILLVYTDDNMPNGNPYVKTLKTGLENIGCNVDWGLDHFWNDYEQYDIIHFQWPDTIFYGQETSDPEINKLITHIDLLKKKGIKLVYTRHNLRPHYNRNKYYLKLYKIIEENCDAVLHMGNYSIQQFKANVNNKKAAHYIIPHHTYDHLYTNNITQQEAREN